jgi:hypothetical protein
MAAFTARVLTVQVQNGSKTFDRRLNHVDFAGLMDILRPSIEVREEISLGGPFIMFETDQPCLQ